jgi:hypothetical protein
MTDEKLYDHCAELWKHFASWRDKLFAGYLTVLGALSFALSQQTSPGRQSLVLTAAGVMSLVFWIHDVRVRTLFSAMQAAAESLEPKIGGYTALNKVRFHSRSVITHAMGVNLLVTAVVAACANGLFVLLPRWCALSPLVAGKVMLLGGFTWLLLYTLAYKVGRIEMAAEKQLKDHLLENSESKK